VSSSHVVVNPRGKEWSHAHALSLREKGNKCRCIASLAAPLIFKVSQTLRNTKRCRLGSFKSALSNYDCYIMEMSASFSSKLLAGMRGIVILGVWLWATGVT